MNWQGEESIRSCTYRAKRSIIEYIGGEYQDSKNKIKIL